MLARVMSSGWAMRFPVMMLIFVLSDDKVTPNSVAYCGIRLYGSMKLVADLIETTMKYALAGPMPHHY
jgi:hypothetical protein